MEESNNVKSTGSGWKKSKNFIYWILGGIIIVFLVISYMPTQRGGFHLFAEPVQTYWNDVKNNMLRNHDVEEIEVVNKKTIHIYLKKSSYQKYADRFPGGISSPSKGGPQFSFEIASLDVFNSELDKTLSEFSDKDKVLVTYINTIGGINNFMWRILILSLIYFIPSIIGRRNRDRKAIFLVNLFLGWTGIGWIATFIWAVFKK